MRPGWDDLRFDEMIYGVPKPVTFNHLYVEVRFQTWTDIVAV